MSISELIKIYESRQNITFNLVASENLMSAAARYAMQCDINHRYCIPPEDQRPKELWDYPNQDVLRQIEDRTKQYAKKIYYGSYADVRPLSGNNAAYILLKALTLSGGNVMSVPPNCGGHFATATICRHENLNRIDLPYDIKNGVIDISSCIELRKKIQPDIIFLDASMQLFPHPVKELRDVFGEEIIISYDASHTLGIIGGGKFQSPLIEGADIIQGSTHKSLFGPQKALIVCKDNNHISERINNIITPLFVSNMHLHHVAALGIALEEMESFGNSYADQVVKNAKKLGKVLYGNNINILFPQKDFTENHQIICDLGSKAKALTIFKELEEVGLHVNIIAVPFTDSYGLRIGLSEVTRRGLKEDDISYLGKLIVDIIKKTRSLESILNDTIEFSKCFNKLHYC